MSGPGYLLRPCAAIDRDFLWSLKRRTLRPYIEQTWGRWDETAQRDHFLRTFSAKAVEVIVVEGRNAGMVEVARKPTEIFLANIAVSPEFQGRGIGAAIITSLQTEARAAALPVHLQVLKANPRARALYTRLGFLLTGETSTHHLMAWHR